MKTTTRTRRTQGVLARYDGQCFACRRRIQAGLDYIARGSRNRWVHTVCSQAGDRG